MHHGSAIPANQPAAAHGAGPAFRIEAAHAEPHSSFWSITSALAGLPVRLRHGGHLRRGADDPVAVGPEPRRARHRHGLGAVRHGPRFAAGRLADGSIRPPGHAALDRRPVPRLGDRVRLLAGRAVASSSPRFIGGLGIGISTVAAPLYISEIAPPAYRGRLAGMFQFNIVFGILVAFASNALLGRHRRAAPGAGCSASRRSRRSSTPSLCFGLPESPRWLLGAQGRPRGRDSRCCG